MGSGPPLCAGPAVPEGYVRLREDGQGYDCDDSIRLGYRDDRGRSGEIEVSPEGLAPNTATSLFEVPFSLIGRLEIWVESSDCDPDNQRYVLELPGDPDAVCLF